MNIKYRGRERLFSFDAEQARRDLLRAEAASVFIRLTLGETCHYNPHVVPGDITSRPGAFATFDAA